MVLLGGVAIYRQPSAVIAANGGNAIIGVNNFSTSNTQFWNTADSATCAATNAALVGCGATGVTGYSPTGVGVQGQSGGTAVYGLNTGATGIGVRGETSGSGSGVYGLSNDAGVGVFGDAPNGTGVLAHSTNGTALSVTGKAKFSRSGVVTFAAGTSSKTVTLAGVTTSSMVLATAQQNTTRMVKAAVPGTGSFVIKLNGTAPTGGLRVAYFVLN